MSFVNGRFPFRALRASKDKIWAPAAANTVSPGPTKKALLLISYSVCMCVNRTRHRRLFRLGPHLASLCRTVYQDGLMTIHVEHERGRGQGPLCFPSPLPLKETEASACAAPSMFQNRDMVFLAVISCLFLSFSPALSPLQPEKDPWWSSILFLSVFPTFVKQQEPPSAGKLPPTIRKIGLLCTYFIYIYIYSCFIGLSKSKQI